MHLKEWLLLLLTVFLVVGLWVVIPALTAKNIQYISDDRDNLQKGIILFSLTFLVMFFHKILSSQNNYAF